MLPQDPPPWFIRSTAWLLIAMFGVALLAAVLVKLPETVTCPFVLVPRAAPIRSSRRAWRWSAKVSVAIGQTVKAGDPLYVLRSDEIRGWGTEQQTLGEDLHTHEEGLAKADAAYASALRNQECGNFAGGKRSGISRKTRRQQSRAAHATGETDQERRHFAGRGAAISARGRGIRERPERRAAHLAAGEARAAANGGRTRAPAGGKRGRDRKTKNAAERAAW